MITYVVAYKSKKGMTKYNVGYGRKEMRYTNTTLPQTVKRFMETHSFSKSEQKIIFK